MPKNDAPDPDQLPLRGAPRALKAKVRAFFAAKREANLREAEGRARWAGRAQKGAIAMVAAGGVLGATVEGGIFILSLIVAGLTYGLSRMARGSAARLRENPDFRPDLRGFLDEALTEAHPRHKVAGAMDLRPLTTGKREGTSRSPHSGATKEKWRKHWLDLHMALVDGSLLALKFTTIGKTKSGVVIRSEHQVRGRWRLVGPFPPALATMRRAGRLDFDVIDRDGHVEILFWGHSPSPAGLVADLARFCPEAGAAAQAAIAPAMRRLGAEEAP